MKAPSKLIGLVLVILSVVVAACSHQKIVQVGTHKVTVSRHGFQKKLYSEVKDGVPMFEYVGVSTAGDGLKVWLAGDKVKVNGKDGLLKPGDSVFISDDGVLVNQLDYGDSERYLQTNAINTRASN